MVLDVLIAEKMGLIKIDWSDKELKRLLVEHLKATKNLINAIENTSPIVLNTTIKNVFNNPTT